MRKHKSKNTRSSEEEGTGRKEGGKGREGRKGEMMGGGKERPNTQQKSMCESGSGVYTFKLEPVTVVRVVRIVGAEELEAFGGALSCDELLLKRGSVSVDEVGGAVDNSFEFGRGDDDPQCGRGGAQTSARLGDSSRRRFILDCGERGWRRRRRSGRWEHQNTHFSVFSSSLSSSA